MLAVQRIPWSWCTFTLIGGICILRATRHRCDRGTYIRLIRVTETLNSGNSCGIWPNVAKIYGVNYVQSCMPRIARSNLAYP